MQKKTFITRLILLVLITLFVSCDLLKHDAPPTPEDKYLVSYEKHKTYLTNLIKSFLNIAAENTPELESTIEEVKHSISVYTISYLTTFNGKEVVASGLVSVPNSGNIQFPMISFQNGTNTSHAKAPSEAPDSELFMMLEFVASTGFVVVIPDYLGFGVSDTMFHPYLDKASTVQSVSDMWKAVEELLNNYLNIKINNDLYITGYSQGGWATMQLQNAIESGLVPDFNLKASACCSGPYDLNYINNYVLNIDHYGKPHFLGYVFNSYKNLGIINTPFNEVFKPPYNQLVDDLYDGSLTGNSIDQQLTTDMTAFFTDDYRQNATTDTKFSSIINAMKNNSIKAWKTITPTRLYHGTADDLVPEEVSKNIYDEFLTQGITDGMVEYISFPGLNHTTAIIPTELSAMNWFIELKNRE